MTKSKTHGEYIKELMFKGINNIPIDNYLTGQTPIRHTCINNHIWNVRPVDILRGSGCPICYKETRSWSPDFYKNKLIDLNIHHIPLENYINSRTKILHKCGNCGNEWKVVPSSIMRSKGTCPNCAVSGFNINKPAILYYLKFRNGFYKIGISNKKSAKLRFPRNYSKIEKILLEKFYDVGLNALNDEREILLKYNKYRVKVPRYLDDNGNTEFFKKDILNLDLDCGP